MDTKIIATIGPKSSNYNTLKKMTYFGMDIIRINTKYGSKQQYLEILKNLKKVNTKRKNKVKVLFDIKDNSLIEWLNDLNFDYLAISYAEELDHIKEIKEKLRKKKPYIISKIETRKGIKNLISLIDCSDGIMIGRGDLGRNIPYEEVPIAQKIIINECNKKNKIVITATEMLLSMVSSKIPSRAEVSDVANAVLDGSSMVMLSEETAIGEHPELCVEVMKKIIRATHDLKKGLELIKKI
ncbi:MAG TPA: pyruvate kinase [Candidatus Woesearchaeota archaeon]|nr:pyruvate kinase [Candidatus Woesearchaeota archaeon]